MVSNSLLITYQPYVPFVTHCVFISSYFVRAVMCNPLLLMYIWFCKIRRIRFLKYLMNFIIANMQWGLADRGRKYDTFSIQINHNILPDVAKQEKYFQINWNCERTLVKQKKASNNHISSTTVKGTSDSMPFNALQGARNKMREHKPYAFAPCNKMHIKLFDVFLIRAFAVFSGAVNVI